MGFDEKSLENLFIDLFKERGYEYVDGGTIIRDLRQIVIYGDLKQYLQKQYPDFSEFDIQTVARSFTSKDGNSYVNNRNTLRNIRDGFKIKREDGKTYSWVNLVDFRHPENNIFKFVNQYEIRGPQNNRIPDGIVFINGIPLVVLEFKSAVREEATIEDAFEQINTRYVRDIPDLFVYNAFTVISDGVNNRIGTAFTDYSNYYAWNKANAKDLPSDGGQSIYTMMDGAFDKERLLDIILNFIYFPDDSGDNEKIVCRYPQYFGATELLENIKKHMKSKGDGKGGTYFGTTGCGKSFTMMFLTRMLMRSEHMGNPTVVLITDRDNLDSQLHKQFVKSKEFLCDENVISIDSGVDLKKRLKDVRSGGVYLSTIQKFHEDGIMLSDRSNIIVISDEAHRSQLNLEETDKIVKGKRTHSIGFAKILHDCFPNATYVGFTGTPVDETMAVFGDIVDEYTMAESEKDKITSKIVYEGRAAKVTLSEEQMRAIEQYYKDAENKGSNEYQIKKSKEDLAKLEEVIGHESRLEKVADDFIAHYEKRVEENATVCGKAMFVCAKRKIAFKFYNILKSKRPEWFVKKDSGIEAPEGEKKAEPIEMVKLVATRGKDDPEELYNLCGDDKYRDNLDIQFKKIDSNFKIAIVVDMWLTGFDVPFLDAIYIDKPIQKHSLIQAISRVNRIYDGKDCGLIVDYLGIKKELDLALNKYAKGSKGWGAYPDTEEFVKIVKETLSAIDGRFYGFDASGYYGDDERKQFECLNKAMEFVQSSKEFEKWFMDAVKKLKTAYNNCVYSDNISKSERDRIYFYAGVRSMIFKLTKGAAPDTAMMNREVRKLLERAIQSDQVIQLSIVVDDIERSKIDLLSNEYLSKLKGVPGSNAKFKLLERLTRLVIGEVGKVNKLQADSFSDKFKKIVQKYNDRHIGAEDLKAIVDTLTDEFIERLNAELFILLDEIKKDSEEGEKLGLNPQEKAFFDILEHTTEVFEFEFDHDKMTAMAKEMRECTDTICSKLDWSTRQDVKDDLKWNIAKIMQKYGYPPIYLDGVYDDVFSQMENYKRYSE